MVATDTYYQVLLTLSGKLIEFEVEKNTYNKYGVGKGKFLLHRNNCYEIVPITASKDMTIYLSNSVGKFLEISGTLRNYRCDDVRYNVMQVYNASNVDEDAFINSVDATCKLTGIMAKADTPTNRTPAVQMYLLTNEKYDKHTRLSAVLFNNNKDKSAPKVELPQIGKIYKMRGYIQLNKFDRQATNIDGIDAYTGKLEMVVRSIEEVTYDSEGLDGN